MMLKHEHLLALSHAAVPYVSCPLGKVSCLGFMTIHKREAGQVVSPTTHSFSRPHLQDEWSHGPATHSEA